MQTDPVPGVVCADVLRGDVIITFEDGTCALFSASLLHDSLPLATLVIEPDSEEE